MNALPLDVLSPGGVAANPEGGDTRVSGPGCRMRRGNGALAVVEACVEAMRDLYTFSFASYNL